MFKTYVRLAAGLGAARGWSLAHVPPHSTHNDDANAHAQCRAARVAVFGACYTPWQPLQYTLELACGVPEPVDWLVVYASSSPPSPPPSSSQ